MDALLPDRSSKIANRSGKILNISGKSPNRSGEILDLFGKIPNRSGKIFNSVIGFGGSSPIGQELTIGFAPLNKLHN